MAAPSRPAAWRPHLARAGPNQLSGSPGLAPGSLFAPAPASNPNPNPNSNSNSGATQRQVAPRGQPVVKRPELAGRSSLNHRAAAPHCEFGQFSKAQVQSADWASGAASLGATWLFAIMKSGWRLSSWPTTVRRRPLSGPAPSQKSNALSSLWRQLSVGKTAYLTPAQRRLSSSAPADHSGGRKRLESGLATAAADLMKSKGTEAEEEFGVDF